jgi:UDP-N-acetylmuramate dehydrogenase
MKSHAYVSNASLKLFNTFNIDALASKMYRVDSTEEASQIIRQVSNENLLVLGGGSNILFTKNWEGTVLLNGIRGKEVISENNEHVILRIGAGEPWHPLVMHTVAMGWGGIENLALIPGKAGAAPMQNIGAYGVELKDTLFSVETLELKTGKSFVFNADECGLSYRESYFKTIWKGSFLITAICLKLNKNPKTNTAYGAIEEELEHMGVSKSNYNLSNVSQAIINIRKSKLPDPLELPNAGSFFKNPILDSNVVSKLIEVYPHMPTYASFQSQKIKVAAGWLIEQVGLKGYRKGDAGVHSKQALVLVNYGSASGNQMHELALYVKDRVLGQFGIDLELEVNII